MSETVERDANGRTNIWPAITGISGLIKHRLFLRFLSINAAGTALLGAAWLRGWIDPIFVGDSTGLTVLIAAAGLRLGMASYIAPIRQIANSLVLLGLIGTVVGFIIALSGVDPDTVSDVNAISPMVSTLLSGMAVALNTTLVGAALNLWLTVNYHVLSAETAQFTIKLTASGEVDARA